MVVEETVNAPVTPKLDVVAFASVVDPVTVTLVIVVVARLVVPVA